MLGKTVSVVIEKRIPPAAYAAPGDTRLWWYYEVTTPGGAFISGWHNGGKESELRSKLRRGAQRLMGIGVPFNFVVNPQAVAHTHNQRS